MRLNLLSLSTAICFLLAGCGGAQTVTRTNAPLPEQIKSAAFSPQAGNSPEVDLYISDALAEQSVVTNPPVAAGVRRSPDSDTVITYTDVWRWDLAMYLQSISINLYDAKSGQLLVSGRWRDSLFHAYNRGESVSKELVTEMFNKLKP